MTTQTGETKGERLLRSGREATELRAYRTHPDVAALRIERVRIAVNALVWTGIVLGLAFTMANVQQFAARGAQPGSLTWVTAWFLDPMVSLCLIGVLLAESTLAKYQIPVVDKWVPRAKRGLLLATYVMNTWSAWFALDASLIVLHSVPVLVVFVMAEAVTVLRDRLTEAVLAAYQSAATAVSAAEDALAAAAAPAQSPALEAVSDQDTATPRATKKDQQRAQATKKEQLRALLADELGPVGPGANVSAIAREFAPRVDMHESTARTVIKEFLKDRECKAATDHELGGQVVPLARGGH